MHSREIARPTRIYSTCMLFIKGGLTVTSPRVIVAAKRRRSKQFASTVFLTIRQSIFEWGLAGAVQQGRSSMAAWSVAQGRFSRVGTAGSFAQERSSRIGRAGLATGSVAQGRSSSIGPAGRSRRGGSARSVQHGSMVGRAGAVQQGRSSRVGSPRAVQQYRSTRVGSAGAV